MPITGKNRGPWPPISRTAPRRTIPWPRRQRVGRAGAEATADRLTTQDRSWRPAGQQNAVLAIRSSLGLTRIVLPGTLDKRYIAGLAVERSRTTSRARNLASDSAEPGSDQESSEYLLCSSVCHR